MTFHLKKLALLSCLALLAACAAKESPPPRVESPKIEAARDKVAVKSEQAADSTVKGAPVSPAVEKAAAVEEKQAQPELTPDQLYSAMLALEDLGRVRARRLPHTFRTLQYLPETSGMADTGSRIGEISREVAGKVFYELKEEGQEVFSSKIAVVEAVPLADFKKETEFGRLLAEYLLTDLADRGLKVSELRLGRDINILPRTGEFIMSRNPGELANNIQDLDYVVVSTFSNTRKSLIVQGRLVNLKNGLVMTAWRHTMPLNRELMGLFATDRKPYRIAVRGMGQ